MKASLVWKNARLVLALWACLALAVRAVPAAAEFQTELGDPVPRFTLQTAAGKSWSSADEAKVTVIQILSVQSAVCKNMMPSSEFLWEKVRDRNVRMIAILRGATPEQAKAFADETKVSFEVAADQSGELCGAFAKEGAPRTIISDAKGNIAYLRGGWRIGREAEFLRVVNGVLEGRFKPRMFAGSRGEPMDPKLVGKPAPEFFVEKWLTPEPPADTTGKFVMTEFWATWCGPCIASMPGIQKLSQDHKDKLVVRSLSDEDPTDVSAFLRENYFSYPIGTDTQRRMADKLGIHSIPFAYITNPEGIVVWQGHPRLLELEPKILEEIFAGKTPTALSEDVKWPVPNGVQALPPTPAEEPQPSP